MYNSTALPRVVHSFFIWELRSEMILVRQGINSQLLSSSKALLLGTNYYNCMNNVTVNCYNLTVKIACKVLVSKNNTESFNFVCCRINIRHF